MYFRKVQKSNSLFDQFFLTAQRILKEHDMHPFFVQNVPAFKPFNSMRWIKNLNSNKYFEALWLTVTQLLEEFPFGEQ